MTGRYNTTVDMLMFPHTNESVICDLGSVEYEEYFFIEYSIEREILLDVVG